jgi:FdhD protein
MLHREKGCDRILEQPLILEEPISIRIQGKPYAVVMRTPGEEIAHAAGFALAEGIVARPEDIATIGYCTEEDTNVVTLTLTPERKEKVGGVIERRGYVSQTSCGICGKEMIQDLHQIMVPNPRQTKLAIEDAEVCAATLEKHQALYEETGSTHAALIFDHDLTLVSNAEDVGRHNALDKAVGKLFLAGRLREVFLVVLSSRISYELVQKAGRAGAQVIVGLSRPTALAVDLARSLNISLATRGKRGGFSVFCGKKRFEASFSAGKEQKVLGLAKTG